MSTERAADSLERSAGATRSEVVRLRALSAYERGRLKTALFRAVVVAVAVASLSVAVRGPSSLVFVPLLVATVLLAEWRGRLFGQGVRRGTVLGLVSWLLPMAVLRPCCESSASAPMAAARMASECCTMPACCLAAGVCLGLAFSLVTPRGRRGDFSGAIGLASGALAVTVLRCTGLFAGEALGLLGGLALGALVAGGARVALVRAAA